MSDLRPLSPRIQALLDEATEILRMAEGLRAAGKTAASLMFALIGNERLRAIRALQAMEDANCG